MGPGETQGRSVRKPIMARKLCLPCIPEDAFKPADTHIELVCEGRTTRVFHDDVNAIGAVWQDILDQIQQNIN